MCSTSDSTGSGLLRSYGPPHSEDNLLDNSTEACQQHKEPDYCSDGSVMTPGSAQNFRVPVLSVLLPLHPALAPPQPILLCQEVRLCSLWAKGKILLAQARYWGLRHLRQPLHLLLWASQQMNVNSRSNITKRKQTYLGDWLDFCLPQHCMSPRYRDWISEGVYSSAPIQRKQLKWLCPWCGERNACVCTFVQIELLLWNYLWLNMLCSKQD